ncbi:hypothetical protein [Pseudomonas sp. EL_65y_Pfl2_R96]|uniref:hypothetical protein n=1 Tax=Pseudomonas sp. EL_65y_Pfl2_R96 TaxID=3088699 RepID=UPI0030DB1D13
MTQTATSAEFQLPSRLGVAADLCFSVSDHVGYLADCLLVHNEVVIPLDAEVLNRLEAAFDTKALRLLIREKKIRFCPSYSLRYANKVQPQDYNRDQFFRNVRTADFFKEGSDRDDLFSEIEETFIEPIALDYSRWVPAKNDVIDSFAHYAGRSGYEFLFPSEHYYYQTGAITGVARMNDLLLAGVPSMEMDQELPQLLELCFPIRHSKAVSTDADHFATKKVINDLHKINNLPTFEIPGFTRTTRTDDEIKSIISVILSDEAQNLRVWLTKNLSAGLDVRAAYDSAEKLLPSKQAWTNWLRFGLSTGVGTVAGMLMAGAPGAAVGAAVGAADLAVGEKLVGIFDGYHPKVWLSHMQRAGLLTKTR